MRHHHHDRLGNHNTDNMSNTTTENSPPLGSSRSPHYVDSADETTYERVFDVIIGLIFLFTALVAAKRMVASSNSASSGTVPNPAETTVVRAFYSLIFATSVLRSLWFLIPATVWQPSYTPMAVYANEPGWVASLFGELIVTAGSLTLFAIFILILVYWADILKKYFEPGSRRRLPMITFLTLVAILVVLELINVLGFCLQWYTTEGMVLFNAVLLAIVSIICTCQITVFSHRFRIVLKTLGAINQVSTDSQIQRIVWITVTGNVFFFTRALLETLFAVLLLIYWHKHGTVEKAFGHAWWDRYSFLKYGSEVTILGLMQYILENRFSTSSNSSNAPSLGNNQGYAKVPDAVTGTVSADV